MACCGRESTDDFLDQESSTSSNQQEPDTLQNFQLSSSFVLNTKLARVKREMELGLSAPSTTVDANFFRRYINIPLINGFGDNSQGFHADTVRMRRNILPFLTHHVLCLREGKLAVLLDVVVYPEIPALRSGGAQLYKEFEANLAYKRLCLKNRLTSKFLPPRTRTSANRIFQIKQEEGMDIASREAMHERKMHIAMQISQTWEETLNLNGNNTVNQLTIRNIQMIPASPMASLTKKPRKDSHNF